MKKYRTLVVCLCILFILPRLLSAQNKQGKEIVFVNNAQYTLNLQAKVLAAFEQQKPLILSQLQEEERKSLNNKNKASVSGLATPRKKDLSSAQVYQENLASVFMVGMLSRSAWDTMPHAELMATAYAINSDGVFATNYHVMRPLLSASVSSTSRKVNIDSSLIFIMDGSGNIYFVDSLLAYNQANDVALFRANTRGQKTIQVRFGDGAAVGEQVFCLSHPDNNFYYFTEGIVNQYYEYIQPHSSEQRYAMNISADYAVGSSGGPIFDRRGNLAGMVSLTRAIYAGYNQQGQQQMILKQAVPVSYIKSLIQQ